MSRGDRSQLVNHKFLGRSFWGTRLFTENTQIDLITMAVSRLKGESKGVDASDIKKKLKRKKKKSWFGLTGVSESTWQATLVLFLAMATALFWNHIAKDWVDETVISLLRSICGELDTSSDTKAGCNPVLAATRRTHQASHDIRKGTMLVTIPRDKQLWDLDALRSNLGLQLLKAKTKTSPEFIDAGAVLAARLAQIQGQIRKNNTDDVEAMEHYRDYINVLPKYSDFAEFHPLLWSQKELELALTATSAYDTIKSMQNQMESEYEAFKEVSVDFTEGVSREAYKTARLNVWTRSFGTGPLPANEAAPNQSLDSELKMYAQHGIDLSKGSHAMVPILDLYNHHARPNVGFTYNTEARVFEVRALKTIPVGTEIMDSYGKHTDSHLFAKYGFINGDGSGYIQGSIAIFHSPLSANGNDTPRGIQALHYLQYDDGYQSCVDQSQQEAWAFKQRKLRLMMSLLKVPERWNVFVQPPSPLSEPARSSDQPITSKIPTMNPRTVKMDTRLIFSTCRLIVMTHTDYNGTAADQLEAHIGNASYVLPESNEALEFRTMFCVARMALTATQRIRGSADGHKNIQENLRVENFGKRLWMVAHVKFGELMALEAIQSEAFTMANGFKDFPKDDPAYKMRNDPCGVEYLQPLFESLDDQE
jgi:hypothetical protein